MRIPIILKISLSLLILGTLGCTPKNTDVDNSDSSISRKEVSSSSAQTLESEIGKYLQPYLETGNFSGSILIGREGEVIFSKGYGMANVKRGDANNPNTVFHLASVSRVITSVAILVMEQQGMLSVEDPLSKYFPNWPRGDDITVHDLLTLSAGFPNINTLPGYNLWQYSRQTPESLVEKFRDLPLEFEPGTRSVHSNSNYNVLALLIERLSGLSFGDFLEQEIFSPLGMTASAHHGDASEVIPHAAVGYKPVGRADIDRVKNIDWSVKTGNGSLHSTTNDLYLLDRAIAEARILGPDAIKKTFMEYFPSKGYGWFLESVGGDQLLYISGGSPGYGAYWGRAVNNDITVIVLGNIYNLVPGTIGSDLMAMMLGSEYLAPQISAVKPNPSVLEQAEGSYQFGAEFYNPNGIVNINAKQGHLFSGQHWLMPSTTSETVFIHRKYWSTLEFLRDKNGKIVELKFDNYVGKRQQKED